jgi:hypothetical protein
MGQGFQQRVATALQLPLRQVKLVAGPVPGVPSQVRVQLLVPEPFMCINNRDHATANGAFNFSGM